MSWPNTGKYFSTYFYDTSNTSENNQLFKNSLYGNHCLKENYFLAKKRRLSF